MSDLHICEESCRLKHFDNCPRCFGFGFFMSKKTGKLVPITAPEAHGYKSASLASSFEPDCTMVACEVCGSTIEGLKSDSPRLK